MFCAKCGVGNLREAVYCKNCGNPLDYASAWSRNAGAAATRGRAAEMSRAAHADSAQRRATANGWNVRDAMRGIDFDDIIDAASSHLPKKTAFTAAAVIGTALIALLIVVFACSRGPGKPNLETLAAGTNQEVRAQLLPLNQRTYEVHGFTNSNKFINDLAAAEKKGPAAMIETIEAYDNSFFLVVNGNSNALLPGEIKAGADPVSAELSVYRAGSDPSAQSLAELVQSVAPCDKMIAVKTKDGALEASGVGGGCYVTASVETYPDEKENTGAWRCKIEVSSRDESDQADSFASTFEKNYEQHDPNDYRDFYKK